MIQKSELLAAGEKLQFRVLNQPASIFGLENSNDEEKKAKIR